MRICESDLAKRSLWEEKSYHVPKYDRKKMIEETRKNPFWLHLGAGNIFRAFQASLVEELLNRGELNRGIIVAEGYDEEIITKIYRPSDNYHISVIFKSDGKMEKEVIGSIAESLLLNQNAAEDWSRLVEIFTSKSLQMVTFTITEKGYSLTDSSGVYLKQVKEDFHNGPQIVKSYIGKVAALLYERYQAGCLPLALVSMDNCSHNGDLLKEGVLAFAKQWESRGSVSEEFVQYLSENNKVTFPWTMIDKITPRPDVQALNILRQDGIENADICVTEKETYVGPFVNSEESGYLVIEDAFPNGRCDEFTEVGVIYTDKETVDKVERMKVCTCLNPLHTALAVFGCLLGYEKITDEMHNPLLRRLVERIGYEEGLPAAVHPGILDPENFLDTVLNVRLCNPFLPDTPQRIATDTSQKLSVRFGRTIQFYLDSTDLQVENLKMIPLVFAGWLRYLMEIDDMGKRFMCSPDPRYTKLSIVMQEFTLKQNKQHMTNLLQILRDESIWGVDLEAAGLSSLVLGYFEEMIRGEGAVEATLRKYV